MYNEFYKYRNEFNGIINTLLRIHNGLSYIPKENYLKALARDLINLRDGRHSYFDLTPLEAQQQLVLIWLELIVGYHKSKPNSRMRSWLIRMSCWKIRDWYKKQTRIVTTMPYIPSENKTNPSLFKLDLKFLLYGTSFFPLSELSSYERYLLFLKYKKNCNILEIANIVQKERHTIGLHLQNISNKMRNLKNATQDTR
jgi:DNA-directed RNA polymerase specialized sigma24 family protein